MNIISPYARLLGPNLQDEFNFLDGIALLRKIEYFGRVSHRSEDAQTKDSWERFIQAVVIGHGDWSITEHASVTVDMVVDRGITHEIVRHRLFSFTQESTRFVNYEKKMPPSFVCPISAPEGHAGDCACQLCTNYNDSVHTWVEAIGQCEKSYAKMIQCGNSPQVARSVFPNALASRIIITGNLRNWRHFFIMRTTKEAHPQMREVAIPLLEKFQSSIPLLYDDIIPMDKQAEGMKKAR